jgi:hypothetical protein
LVGTLVSGQELEVALIRGVTEHPL